MDQRISELKAALLGPCQVRRTWKQKTAFVDWVTAYAEALDVSVSVEESGKHLRSRNIVLGDVEKARMIVTAHYDTCTWMPLGAGMTPGCWPVIVLIELVQLLFLPLILLNMFFGISNPHTANDNTSGVMSALLLMERLKGQNVAFVLFDNEESGLLGSMAFAKAHPQAARRFVLNLDCVGDGGTWLLTGSKPAMQHPTARRLLAALESCALAYGMKTVSGPFPKWLYPSDQMLFPRGAAVAALKGKRILYLDRIHTARDTILRDDNLLCLCEAIQKSLEPIRIFPKTEAKEKSE